MGIEFANTPYFTNFIGVLDGVGQSTASFSTVIPVPGAAGMILNFGYALKPWDFASTAINVEIIP